MLLVLPYSTEKKKKKQDQTCLSNSTHHETWRLLTVMVPPIATFL